MNMTNKDFDTINAALHLASISLDPNEPFLVEARGVMDNLAEKKRRDNTRVSKYYREKRKENKQYGREPYRLSGLTKTQLKRLREDIALCSLYENDFKNRYDIDPKQVSMFFDGYAEYIGELMKEDGIDDAEFFDHLSEYDTIDNLLNWHGMVYL